MLAVPPEFLEALAEAVACYEAAYQRSQAAFNAGYDAIDAGQMETLADAHPAALDYQVARAELWSSSDALAHVIAKCCRMAVRRGDVLYARTSVSRTDEQERATPQGRSGSGVSFPLSDDEVNRLHSSDVRIMRFDLGRDSEYVVHLDA